ncbi:hypothetical protein ACFP3Q_10820 [Nocardioides sp. GCM10027113]|uniref:hypothetical protein n=1 Tax=unclassified Nocardioides TaxID=2615069 RepID=UPI003618D6FE
MAVSRRVHAVLHLGLTLLAMAVVAAVLHGVVELSLVTSVIVSVAVVGVVSAAEWAGWHKSPARTDVPASYHTHRTLHGGGYPTGISQDTPPRH